MRRNGAPRTRRVAALARDHAARGRSLRARLQAVVEQRYGPLGAAITALDDVAFGRWLARLLAILAPPSATPARRRGRVETPDQVGSGQESSA